LLIFLNLVPIHGYESAFLLFLIVLLSVFDGFFILLGLSTIYFSYFYHIPKFICTLILIFKGTIGYIGTSLFGNFTTILFRHLFDKDFSSFYVFPSLLVIFFVFIYFILFATIFTISFPFHPESLATLYPLTRLIIQIITIVINFAVSFLRNYSIYFVIIVIFLYVALIYSTFFNGGMVNSTHHHLISSSSAILILIFLIFQISLNSLASSRMYVFFIFFILFFSFLVRLILHKFQLKSNKLLDNFQSNKSLIDSISSSHRFLEIFVYGFRFCHSPCLSWHFF
jgi:hypothetical protein